LLLSNARYAKTRLFLLNQTSLDTIVDLDSNVFAQFLQKKNAQPEGFYHQKWVARISLIAIILGIAYFCANFY